jgi:hypothetical protein
MAYLFHLPPNIMGFPTLRLHRPIAVTIRDIGDACRWLSSDKTANTQLENWIWINVSNYVRYGKKFRRK